MSVRRKIYEHNGLYFITFTCARWIPLYQITDGYTLVYKWFDYLKTQGHFLIAYTIMPDHVHCLIAFKQTKKSINTIVANGKRFMAYDLVKLLQQQNQTAILQKLSSLVNDTDRSRNKKHEIFEPSFDCKECRSDKFVWQKIEYIHNNAVAEKYKLVELAEEYEHSSASQYFKNEVKQYEVLHYKDLEDIDLSIE
jgi:REP element-mobilizing transposase RayT